MTEQGQRAQEILNWAWEDPAARKAEAAQRLNEMADGTTGQALAEIQDAGTMLNRLVIPQETISSQLGMRS